MSELDSKVEKMQRNFQESLDIIKRKNIPLAMLGHVEFLDGGMIKQKRVLLIQDVLDDLCSRGEVDEFQRILEKVSDFIIELWKYGIFEHTSKIGHQFGMMGEDVVLIDFGEINDCRDSAEKQVRDKKWLEQMARFKYSSKEVLDCFSDVVDRKLTLDFLNENWGKLG